MVWLALLAALAQSSVPRIPPAPLDVSRVTTGDPVTVAEIDLGALLGHEIRQLGWSPDGRQLYFQTIDGEAPDDLVHYYTVALEGGSPHEEPAPPQWAFDYWAFKSDRFAPGIPSIAIDLATKIEIHKVGTGSAGALDRTSSGLGANNVMNAENLEREAQHTRERLFQLVLYGEPISEFLNRKPIPGLMFSWGPEATGAIAYTDRDGRLRLLDRQQHKHRVAGAKDAVLPAWSRDGRRLAYLQHAGRRKYRLRYVTVTP